MFCSKCGNRLVENAVFCSHCGHKVVNSESASPAQPVSDSGKDVFLRSSTDSRSLLATWPHFEYFPSRMGGKIGIKTRISTVQEVRQELQIDGQAKAQAGTTLQMSRGHNSDTSWAAMNTHLDVTLNMTAKTNYSYWIRWEDGSEQLYDLPLAARPGQQIVHVYLTRENATRDEDYLHANFRLLGMTRDIQLFAKRDNAVERSREAAFFLNSTTGENFSLIQDWTFAEITEDAYIYIRQTNAPSFTKGLFRKSFESYAAARDLVCDVASDTQQQVISFINRMQTVS